LKTTREKNAEHLLRQGKRWEKERIVLEENEKQQAIEAQKERENLLEKRILYVFDDEPVGKDVLKIHDNNFDECEKDLEQYLKDEQERMRTRGRAKKKVVDVGTKSPSASSKSTKSSTTDKESDKVIDEQEVHVKVEHYEPAPVDPEIALEEIRQKMLSKRPEDPRLAKFKQAEVRFLCFLTNFLNLLKISDLERTLQIGRGIVWCYGFGYRTRSFRSGF
jgi:hypothetical protein